MATTAPRVRPARRRSRLSSKRKEALTAYAFISPNLLVFSAFMFLPLVLVFSISTQETSGLGPSEFVGLDNYSTLLSDSVFWRSLANTFGYAAASVPICLAAGLGVALLLNRAIWMQKLMRTVYYLPVVISGVAAGLIGTWMFNENVGVINKVITAIGFAPVSWQSTTVGAMAMVIITTLWVTLGFNMVVYLAALQNIDRQLYDASAVDGASQVQQFRHITLPGLATSTVFLATYGVITSFQVFDLIYILTRGGPGNATEVLGTYAYDQAFDARERGYGAAIGVVLYLILMLALAAQLLINRRRNPKEL